METRILYAPNGISWDAQLAHGRKLFEQGYVVEIHEHSYVTPCGLASAARCIRLTDGGSSAILEADSKTG